MKKGTLFTTFVLIIVVVGFYFVISELADLRSDLRNLELTLEISNKDNGIISEATSTESGNLSSQEGKVSVIPTAIIFETLSSPLLEPQTKVTVTVESISLAEDGTVALSIRAFTSEATAYSALQPQNFFELIDLEAGGKTIKPAKTDGAFSSIPPKSAASGRVYFKINPSLNSVILQINYENSIKYYELDFGKKTYKETAIG